MIVLKLMSCCTGSRPIIPVTTGRGKRPPSEIPATYVGRGLRGGGRRYPLPPGARHLRPLSALVSAAAAVSQDLQQLKQAIDDAGRAGLSRRDIRGQVFKNSRTKEQIDELLYRLKTEYPAEYRIWDQLSDSKRGRPAVYAGAVRYPLPPGARYPRAMGPRFRGGCE